MKYNNRNYFSHQLRCQFRNQHKNFTPDIFLVFCALKGFEVVTSLILEIHVIEKQVLEVYVH